MILSALLALTSLAAPEETAVFHCWAALGPVEGVRSGKVYLEQDRARRLIRHTLSVRTDEFAGGWAIGPRGGNSPYSMRHLSFWLPIPEGTAGPVRVSVVADGRAFWSGSVPPNSRVVVEPGGDVVSLPVVQLMGGSHGTFPSIMGVRRLEISAHDGLENPIVQRTIDLPDWGRIARQARRAVRQVDRLVAGGAQCLPTTMH